MRHTLYFIRHGETDWNRVGRLQGHKDIPLNDAGRAQARRHGRLLKGHLGNKQLSFVASPLKRACETMEIIRAEMNLPVKDYILEGRLKEISFGASEGYTAKEIEQHFPEQAMQRAKNKWGYQPPRGESYAMLTGRIQGWLKTVDQDMVVVSHGAVSRVVRKLLLNLCEGEALKLPTPQDKIMRIHDEMLTWL